MTLGRQIDPWAVRSRFYGLCESSDRRRWPSKVDLFRRGCGRTLLIAAGTGLDFAHLPAVDVVAIERSSKMLSRARRRRRDGPARVTLLQADAESLPFPAHAFDTVITSFTMCSIPHPAVALAEIRRTLKPGGRLLMFEHVRSRHTVLGFVLDVMTLWSRVGGSAMNRKTVAATGAAGFEIVRVDSVFLDIIVAVEAVSPRGVAASPA